MSHAPAIKIRFDGDLPVYRPGDTLSGRYWFESLDAGRVKAVEVSVLWHTEGKGDEDMAVHQFWRFEADDLQPIEPDQQLRFSTTLPNSPLSFRGQIVSLRWCVRVRMFPNRGRELLGEKEFQLGEVVPVVQ